MGQILVRVEQLRKGAGGRTLLVVEGNFRKCPETASTFARAASVRVKLRPLSPSGNPKKKRACQYFNTVADLGHGFCQCNAQGIIPSLSSRLLSDSPSGRFVPWSD